MGHCHCSMCRKHHGALFVTFVAAPIGNFRWLAGQQGIGSYESSPGGSRSFCLVCGSVAPLLLAQLNMVFIPAGNLQGDLGIKPDNHIFVGSKAPWYEITDGLPQYEQFPPGFDAPPIERPLVAPKEGVTQGSCLCGDVAYEIEGRPLYVRSCHCSRCRRARSAAHATNAFYTFDQFHWVRGAGQVVDYKHADAKYFGAAFCSRCGGSAPRASRERGLVVVAVGSLDTDPQMRPQAHIFVGSKAGWFDITDDIPQFAEMPAP
ncbi:MAG TPA: GFA family protein [Steroidobacteraceae bacterium]|nr:GFA family protein [Steroidobacteraceae bacterium]